MAIPGASSPVVNSLDLIIFAALAVFLGWKLYTVLGRRTGNERQIDPFATPGPKNGTGTVPGKPGDAPGRAGPKQIEGARAGDDAGRVEEQRPSLPREHRQLEAIIAQAPEAARKGLEAIRGADPEFEATTFLAGAKIAFDMILTAFAAGDTNALKPMLAPDVLANFSAAIAERQREKQTLKTTLVGITGLELLGAEMKGPEARVTLKFISQQVNVTQDSEGRIIDGHPNEVTTIDDVWTFARPVTSRDPNWLLVATESPN
jgi:predicted lipid-binding transport protein (Tim44 family)